MFCQRCGRVIEDENKTYVVEGEFYCKDCFLNKFSYCDRCESIIYSDDLIYIEDTDEMLCPDCAGIKLPLLKNEII